MTPLVKATLAHAEAMAAIHETAFPPGDVWSANVFRLQLEIPSCFGLIHPDGGVILGRVAADEAEILTLAVTPARRRAGIGARLLRDAMHHAHAAGAVTMFLEVAVTNIPARALYASAGFIAAGLRRRYYQDGGDAEVMRALLPGILLAP